MEYYGNTLAVGVEELTRSDDGEAVMSRAAYDKLRSRRRLNVLCRGGGLGRRSLVEYASLPERFRARFEAKYGSPESILRGPDEVELNRRARAFYFDYRLPDGSRLPLEKQAEYTLNASVLDALQQQLATQQAMRRALNNRTRVVWEGIAATSERLRATSHHTLPVHPERLREKLRRYASEGFEVLVSKKFGNANTLKITPEAGRQIIALRRSRTPVYTTRQLFDRFNEIARERGWKPLRSINSLTRYLARPEVKPRWYDAVYGELAARQLFARQHRTRMPEVRDALWYGDGTKLNLYFRARNAAGRSVMRTLQVYEVIDAFSEVMLGYAISEREDFEAQYRAYRMAVETAGHKPYEIVHDNQGGHSRLAATGFLARIARIVRPTAPYSGQSKSIESVFGRFQMQVLHRDWRFTGQNLTARRPESRANREFLEANVEQLYTREELEAAYAAAREEWNAAKHPRTGIPRREMYLASTNPQAPAIDRIDRMALFWRTTQRSSLYTAAGIEIQVDGCKYAYEVLDAEGNPDMAFRARHTGRAFYTMYDPLDMSRVELCTESPAGLRIVATAHPYLTVRRAAQEQGPADRALLARVDAANKRERVRRQLENYRLEAACGVAPEQHGLRTPRLRGLSLREVERLSDELLAAAPAGAAGAAGTSGTSGAAGSGGLVGSADFVGPGALAGSGLSAALADFAGSGASAGSETFAGSEALAGPVALSGGVGTGWESGFGSADCGSTGDEVAGDGGAGSGAFTGWEPVALGEYEKMLSNAEGAILGRI